MKIVVALLCFLFTSCAFHVPLGKDGRFGAIKAQVDVKISFVQPYNGFLNQTYNFSENDK